MEYINVRQMLHDYDEMLKTLPVTVTRFGKPICEVWPVGGKNGAKTEEFNMPDKSKKNVPSSAVEAVDLQIHETCTTPKCSKVADAVGKRWNKNSSEWEDWPMCREHAIVSLREYDGGGEFS